MRRNFDIILTNSLTNDVKIIHNFSDFIYGNDVATSSCVFSFYTREWFVNQVPFKVEFVFK